MGLLLAVLVTAADVDDARAARQLFARLDGQPMGKVVRMYGDTQVPQLRAVRVGGEERGLGAEDRAPARRGPRAG